MADPRSFDQSTFGDTGASKEAGVDHTRALSVDLPAPGDVKQWMDNFFLNQAYGAFCMNVLSDIFVRFFFFICTYFALLRCWRANQREDRLTEQQIQRRLDDLFERQNRYLSSDSFGTIIRRPADTPAAQSTSPPAPLVPGSQVLANSLGRQNSLPILQGGISPAFVAVVDSTIALPTKCEKVVTEVDEKGLQLPKRRNGYNYDCHTPHESSSLEFASTLSGNSTSRSQTAETKVHEVETADDVVIDILPVQGVFRNSSSLETGNKFKNIVKDKVGVSCDHDINSSRIIQARVHATDENLYALRDLAVEGMKLDKSFTLQIGESFLYSCNDNPKMPVLLSLKDVKVPTVFQAEYSAGMLTIRGRYLEGAEIRAATFDGYMILNCIMQEQINNILPPERRIEVWKCTDLLPPVNLNQIQICASKEVRIEGHAVTVRSELSSIQNTTLRTVIHNWMPTTIFIIILIYQAWVLLELLLNLVTDPLHRSWLFYLVLPMVIYTIQLLSPRLEDNIQDFVERLKLTISCFHVLPGPLSSPAFYMRNGYCFQRGAKHLVKCKLMPGGPQQEGRNDKSTGPQQEGRNDKSTGPPQEGSNDKSTSKFDGTPPIGRDWKWPCYRNEYSNSKKKYVVRRFDPDSIQEPNDHVSHPFTVTYWEKSTSKKNINDLPLQYVPQNTAVKLYSKYLQAVIRELLPTKLKEFEKYGEIQASDLLVLYISEALFEKTARPDMESNAPFSSNDESDMFHLIRFLIKEYEETIIQHKRMMEADVMSWDMLWTLLVPRTDVICYCDISKEELCGKVLSTRYHFSDEKVSDKNEFIIELETFYYNCINFEAKRIKYLISSFKDEVKISDIDVHPLQHKANSHKAEEFFLMRGRKFNDWVLKHEHRFMHYQGLVYMPNALSRTTITSYSAGTYKENGDGRVMIDQRGFVKMHPNLDSEIAHPTKGWVQGSGLKVKTAISGFDPILKYAPAIVYGYSFSVRKWGCFRIEGISEIEFIATAFDTLVMNEDLKNTLLILTEHHIKYPQSSKDVLTNVDPFPKKGKGCIILLHGPSGTGKTLTVESLAEKLECPLWQLSVPISSVGPEYLETALLKTFDIAASWRAILVLDEADVYMSSRKYSLLSSDVSQTNAMTGVFLRVLEYYTGILFLTTNVIDSIEPAVYSRMSLFVKYEEFSIENRKQLWINFLNRIGFQHPSQYFWDEVLPQEFNGRVIRNIIQNAQILAQSKGASLSEEYLLKAFRVMATPSTMGHLMQSDCKPDLKQASTTMSTYAPSVVTD